MDERDDDDAQDSLPTPVGAVLGRAELEAVMQGQAERNIMASSIKEYLGRCVTMTNLLNKIPDLREEALELDEAGNALKHSGLARGVLKLRLPMAVHTATLLFAKISVDTTLPRANKRIRLAEDEEPVVVAPDEVDKDPAANKVTVSPQSYQNYKSALKWWHCYSNADMSKVYMTLLLLYTLFLVLK
jgi:hypothetical protein